MSRKLPQEARSYMLIRDVIVILAINIHSRRFHS